MIPVFKKIGLAVSFSPNCEPLTLEAKHLMTKFGSSLVLIHIGEKNKDKEFRMEELIELTGFRDRCTVCWGEGDKAGQILNICKREEVDLILAGAVRKENFLEFYLETVARKLLRKSHCSVLIFTDTSKTTSRFEKIIAGVEYSEAGEKTIKIAADFAKAVGVESITLIYDFYVAGLSLGAWDSSSDTESIKLREEMLAEETQKVEMFVTEIDMGGVKTDVRVLYGKEGFKTANYAKEQQVDLLVLSAPEKRLKIINRLFPHNMEYIFELMPCNILLVGSKK